MYDPKSKAIVTNNDNSFACLVFSPAIVGGASLVFLQYKGMWLTATRWIENPEELINITLTVDDGVEYRADRDLPNLVQKASALTPSEGWTSYQAAGQELCFRLSPFRVSGTNEFIWACYFSGFQMTRGLMLNTSQLLKFACEQAFFCCSFGQFNLLQALIVEAAAIEESSDFPLVYATDKKSIYWSKICAC